MCSLVSPLITHMFRIWKARSSLYVMLNETLHGGGFLQRSAWSGLVIGHELGHRVGIYGKNDNDGT